MLSSDELTALVAGLESVGTELTEGSFQVQPDDEDIHMAVERRLTELIGDPARKLHHGRSRNDLVATDLKLYVRENTAAVNGQLSQVIQSLVTLAEQHQDTPFPGHTHLQQAQVISLGHLLLARAWSLRGDYLHLREAVGRHNSCPLGSGALGGATVPVDRAWLAKQLGFAGPAPNSVEAVTSRDFVLDILYALTRLGAHLSQLAEDFILWSSQEFGFVTLDDTIATGSSLLAHKKNPDVFELLRGKCGRLAGNLTGLLVTLKGLPGGYNKDLQEDKEPLFDSIETMTSLLPGLQAALEGVSFNTGVIAEKLHPALLSERIVAYLTDKGLPFREAYGICGQAVKLAEDTGLPLTNLSLTRWQELSSAFEEDVIDLLAQPWSVPASGVAGGSNRAAVKAQVKELSEWLESVATV